MILVTCIKNISSFKITSVLSEIATFSCVSTQERHGPVKADPEVGHENGTRGCPIIGSVQGEVGQDFEHPVPVKDVHGGGWTT